MRAQLLQRLLFIETMKNFVFVAVVLLGYSSASEAAAARAGGEPSAAVVLGGSEKPNNVKADEEPQSQRPSFPLFTLLPSLSLPALSFPSFPALNIPNPFPPAEQIRATKTEYVEVTRRQTIHPVCYTAYDAKAPCLPYRDNDAAGHLEVNSVNEIHVEVDEPDVEASRSAKYLEFKERTQPKTVDELLEGSELSSVLSIRNPFQRQTTEYVTKTVLVTKLEKITDHRVTATLVAQNCLPVDPKIPRCRGFPSNPILEAPEILQAEESKQMPIIIASVVHPGEYHNHRQQILQAVEAVNQVSQSIQGQSSGRRPQRPHILPPLLSGDLAINLRDDPQSVEQADEKAADQAAEQIVEEAEEEVAEQAEDTADQAAATEAAEDTKKKINP